MKHPDFLILYVENTALSAQFYHRLFAAPIVEESANFAMLALSSGTMLGLWARHDVSPTPVGLPAGFELGVTTNGDEATESALAEAQALGAPVVQALIRLDFGYTFVVKSPDGHLIRVFNPPSE